MSESRLSIIIDSRTAEQKAQDVKRALQALEDAGVRVTTATEAVSTAMGGQAQQSQHLVTSLNSARGAMGRMQQAQDAIKSGQRGLFQPVQAQRYATSIQQVSKATDGAAHSYQRAGMSAKQLQQAQRQLPMQFSDIWVSLASGQAPLQVAIQQGSQLKDSFGGIGPAAKGMAGYIASLVNPLTIAAGSAGALGIALYQSAKQTDEFENALAVTNNTLNTTADRLDEMADRIGDQTQNAGAARQAIVKMVRDGVDSMSELALVAQSVARRNEATGESVEDLVDDYREISNDPIKALTDLDEQYHFLTEDTIRQITKLQEQGREQAAVRFAMEEWANASDEASRKVIENMNGVDRALKEIANGFATVWGGVTGALGDAASRNLGQRGAGNDQDRIQYLQDELSRPRYSRNGPLSDQSPDGQRRQEMEEELRLLEQIQRFREASEIISGSIAQQNSEEAQTLASLNRERENYLTQDRELQKQLEEHTRQREAFREQFEETGDEKWLRAMEGADEKIAAVRDELNGAAEAHRRQQKVQREAQQEADRLMRAYDRQANSLSRQIALYGETGEAAQVRYDIEHGALQDVSEARKQALIQQAEEVDRLEAQSKAQKKYEKQVESIIGTYDSQHQKMQELRDAVVTLNRAYKDPKVEMSFQQYQRALAGIQEEMRKVALESDPVAKEMARAWEEAADRIDETFADAFTGAFDSFDDFADQLLDGFKRLLGELAYQATLKPIVVEFTADMKSALGIGGQGGLGGSGGGFGGIPGIGTAVDKAAGWLGLGGSSLGAAGTAAVGYGSGFGAAAGTGAYTGWAGSAAAGAASSGGIMSSVGAAMPWVGGAMLADNVLGLGIVDGIVDGISGLFGGSPTEFSGRFGMGSDFEHMENPDEGKFYRQSALGAVGFLDSGTERLQRAGMGDSKQWADDLANTTAQVDNLVASLADGQSELQGMRKVVQGMEISSGNAGRIIEFAVKDRAIAALESLGYTISREVANLPADEFAARMESMVGGIRIVEAAADRLNLQFDETASGALSAAGSLAELAGGTQRLQSLQQNYYQTIYSEEERLNRLRSDVTAQMHAMGYALPRTRDGFRQLVEAQNLNTQAGRENYTQLLQLVDSFDQLKSAANSADSGTSELADRIAGLKDNVKSAYETFADQAYDQRLRFLELAGRSEEALAIQRATELETIDASLRPFQRRIWALEDEQEAQQAAAEAGQEYAQALADAQSWLGSTLESISGWIDRNQSTDAGLGTPGDQLAAAGAAYREQLKAARSGDRSALENITQYADRFIAAQKNWSASGDETTALIDKVERQLGKLPEQLTAEEYLAGEIRDALQSVVIEQMPTDRELTAKLASRLDALGADQLTVGQVRNALNPIATDAEISRLISNVDRNGDGIVTAQELTSARLSSLSQGIASSLGPMFASIDQSLDGLINWGEFRAAFKGLASDQQLKQIFGQLDKNGDGTISEIEALKSSTDKVDENTQSLEQRSLDQLAKLNSLVSEMTNTTNQFVRLDSTMVSLRESINALGVAQEEQARIERERAAREKAEQERLTQQRRESIMDQIEAVKDERKSAQWTVNAHQNQSLDWSIAGFFRQHSNVRKGSNNNLDALLSGDYDYTYRPELGTSQKISDKLSKYNAAHDVLDTAASELDALRNQLANLPEFASGGVFTNSIVDQPTPFSMGLMGEAGPEAIMPLTRHADGGLGVRAELPPVPSLPLLGQGDVVEVLNDLRREVAGLRAENKRLLGESNDLASQGNRERAAGNRQSEQQRAAQLREQQTQSRIAKQQKRGALT